MNTSKTNLYLKQLSETIVNAPSSPTLKCEVDTIPALSLNSGTTGSKTLRTTIATDDNVSTKLTSVDTTLSVIQSNTGNIDTSLNNIESDTGNMDTTLNAIASDTGNMDTTLNTINTSLNNIETDVDTLAKTKIFFNARLTDGTNQYLAKADYSGGNALDFYWQNDKGVPVYIYRYRFIYPEGTEPASSELYHSTAWESKIGAMNSAGDDYEAPFITINDNKDYMIGLNGGGRKQSWISDECYVYRNDFDVAPIEIGISRKFGHHINADINTTEYDANPIGIIDAFYYSS